MFQANGQFCFIISEQLNVPYDVSVNANNQLLVADHDNHCICIFTLDGHFINKFGTHGIGRLREPCSLATDSDSDNYILVADTNHHCIVIFDNDGNFVHGLGSEGEACGQLHRPCGIAASSNGSIYVCDSYNKRIQILYS